jgi:Flp pilus assembly protein TadB
MSHMIVRRRDDGIVEIQRATDARRGVHGSLSRVLVLSFVALFGLAVVLELFPRGALLAGALIVLGVLLTRGRLRSRPPSAAT